MAQQPNIEVEPAERPRPVPEPGPARRWTPRSKPGVITAPDQVPHGAAFGTPGPDTGWALRLIRTAELEERSPELEAVLAALMAARASSYGRAPVPEDLAVARILCGLGEGLPASLAERRQRWVEATAHEKPRGRAALADVDVDVLRRTPDEVRVLVGRS